MEHTETRVMGPESHSPWGHRMNPDFFKVSQILVIVTVFKLGFFTVSLRLTIIKIVLDQLVSLLIS